MATPTNNKRPAANKSGSDNRPAAMKRRKKRKSANTYLYIAISLCFVAIAIATAIVCVMVGCDDTPPVEDSSEVVSEVFAESSEVINESSEVIDESSEEESSEAPVDPTTAYEQYIGVEYAIDMTEYEQYVCPEDESRFVYLVNPDHPLAADHVPEDLVWCTNIRKGRPEQWSYMDRTANAALEAFLKEAAYYGFDDITVTNAYRSYSSQKQLFNQYVAEEKAKGLSEEEAIAKVLTYSTRPGTSEHQSGLCCDMHNLPATTSAFDNTPEALWLADNAHRFGFILRYPPNTQHITGIKHESWHFRYVGRTAATEIYELGITLDEYLADEEAN